MDRGLLRIDSLSEPRRKLSFFLSHSGPYWLSYLSISGLGEPLHFLARALSLHLRLFASLSPPVCLRLSSSILLAFFFFVVFFQETPCFITLSCIFLSAKTHICTVRSSGGVRQACGNYIFSSADLFISMFACLCHFSAACCCYSCFVFCVGPLPPYLCFAHLSPRYLLCHGTVNVSDRDRSRWKSTPSFVLCLFCYPSLTLFLFISGRRAGPGLYLVAKFTHWKGRKASNKQLGYS